LQSSEADEAAAECEEGFVDLVATVVADEQSFELVQPDEGALDDPAVAAEPGAVLGLAACDLGCDATPAELATAAVVVVATVGAETIGAAARPAWLAADGRDTVEQRDQLGAVVAVAARDRPGKRDPRRVYEKVMLRTRSGSINRARARLGAPFFACT
jgi:hypothetical protein